MDVSKKDKIYEVAIFKILGANPKKISYLNLLEVFFDTHDPTQVDGQGNDIGSQYMSAIYYTNDMQKQEAANYIERIFINYADPIITKLYSEKIFYIAEDYLPG